MLLGIFILTYLVYNNYIILNEHEVVIILANLVWVSLASSFISSAIYKLLDDKGQDIKRIFVWYLGKKLELYRDLIKYYKSQENFSKKVINITYVCYANIINIIMYLYKNHCNIILKHSLNTNILLQGLGLKYWVISDKLHSTLDKYTDIDKIKELFIKSK